jgi:hypothetical protein
LTRRTSTVVALAAATSIGSSVAKSWDPRQRELLLQLQRVVGVPAGAFDVLTDHGGEPGHRGRGFGEQIGQSPVTRDADAGELLMGTAVAAHFGRQAAGFDVPEPRGDVPARRQLGLALSRTTPASARRPGRPLPAGTVVRLPVASMLSVLYAYAAL